MLFSSLLATVRVALLRSSWHSCFMRATLFKMRATNSSLVFIFLCRLRFSSIPTDKNRICTLQIQTASALHPLKIWHLFIWTYVHGIVHTTTSWNIYYSSWNTLYIRRRKVLWRCDPSSAASRMFTKIIQNCPLSRSSCCHASVTTGPINTWKYFLVWNSATATCVLI